MTTSAKATPKVRSEVKSTFVTLEKYFQSEEKALYKSEYHDGKVIRMAGGTFLHDNLASRMNSLLNLFVDDNDLPYMVNGSETKIRIESYNKVVYADALVILDKPIFYNNRIDTITNPRVVVEVLSKSTSEHDRTLKFSYYRSISTFKEYVLIHQDKKSIAVFTKQEDNTWLLRDYEGDDAVAILYSLQKCPISLKRLYRNMEILSD